MLAWDTINLENDTAMHLLPALNEFSEFPVPDLDVEIHITRNEPVGHGWMEEHGRDGFIRTVFELIQESILLNIPNTNALVGLIVPSRCCYNESKWSV